MDPVTGQELWSHEDDGAGLPYGQVANNLVFYQCWDRTLALDAFTGRLVWSKQVDGLTNSVIADGRLYLLFPEEIQIYQPAHVRQLPQFVDGLGASTLISIVNLSSAANSGTLELFDDAGAPLPIAVEGESEPAAVIPFSLAPSESLRIRTSGTSETLSSGWVRVRSAEAVSAAATYQVMVSGGLYEASVDAAEPTGSASLSVIRAEEFGGLTNTGLALVNVSDSAAEVELEFRGRAAEGPAGGTARSFSVVTDGTSVPQALGVFHASLTLDPGQHVARFLDELFEESGQAEAEGTVLIRSTRPIAVTALRTHDGLPVSSYPVGFPEP